MVEEQKKDRRLKLLWSSNSPWVSSGYAVESRDLMRRFISDGWQAAMIGFSGLEGGVITYENYPVYSKMGEAFGGDAVYFHSKHFQATVTFAMQDIWTLNPQFLQQMINEGRPVIAYVPIDQEPIPPNVINNLRYMNRIISFSKFGQKMLMKAGYTSTYIPEGTDTNIFKPMDKAECRKFLGIPEEAFVIGMVGANKENPPRKGWQQALEAFKLFHDKHPEAIFFYESNQNPGTGFPITHYAAYLGIEKALFKIDDYMSVFHAGSDIMAKMYNAFDILSHASLSEGFGLCIVESQACGTPVVVNDCQSMPELIIPEKTGLVCKPGFKWFSNAGGFHYFPDTNSLYEKYEQLFRIDREKMGKAAREHIVENYNIDTIYKTMWRPYLEELQTELLSNIQ